MADETTTPVSNEAPTGEEKPVTTEKPAPQKMSPAGQRALEALMDREKAIRTQEASLKQQAAEIERKRQEWERSQSPQDPDPMQLTQTELQSLKQELQELKQRDEHYRRQTVVEEERQRVRQVLQNAEEYAAVNATEAYDTVFDARLAHYNETGEWISEEEAAKNIEGQLEALYNKLKTVYDKRQPTPQGTHETATDAFNALSSRMTSEAPSSNNKPPSYGADATREAAQFLRFKTK